MDLMIGNWKMHATHLEAIQMVQKLHYRLHTDDFERIEVTVAPPYTALRSVQTVIETDKLPIRLGAQDVSAEREGAFTGEVSAAMLARLSVSYVIVGHSERRARFGETDETVAAKARAVLDAGMRPVVCVGEQLAQRDAGEALSVVRSQLSGSLARVKAEEASDVVIAYEPVWAIGTGRSSSPDDAAEVTDAIAADLLDRWGSGGAETKVLYGGSVNPGNIGAFMAKRSINGALVGGASLDPDQFAAVVRYWI